VSVHGVVTVARQEFRLRIRAGRWRWLLGAWTAVVLLFAVLFRLGLSAVGGTDDGRDAGPPLFGGTMLFVLGLALLVAPALAAQSVNGDRERGTLAVLQVTRLTAAELALGKLAAAWGTALVFLGLTLPVVVWAMAEGSLPLLNVLVTLLVVVLLLGVVVAVAQALSAVLARSITSALLSYVAVFALTIGTLIGFGLATALTSETVEYDIAGGGSYTSNRARPDRTWPLLAPNPFVILADAAPRLPSPRDDEGNELARPMDPLGDLGDAVREVRRPPQPLVDDVFEERPHGGPVWPYGLTFDVLLAIGAVTVTIRRLRTPVHRLPRGVRIA
jgi:ABC-type transport system involved in multi-copper enzyme maturation permease subunit